MATSSQLVMGTVNSSLNFMIKGYSLVKGMGVGKYIASETFTVGGHQWAIFFYPDGKNPEDNATYVSVFTTLASDDTNVRALFELTLLDQSRRGNHMVHINFDHSLENIGCMCGCVESDIGEHFRMLLDDEELFDVTFCIGGEKFHAHKLVLATQSTVFETQFWMEFWMQKVDQKIVVTDIEPKIFKALLHFIYRDTLIEDEELYKSCLPFLPLVSKSFPAKLLVAAEKYDLPRLKLMCESVLCNEISIDSVAHILVLLIVMVLMN